jgi:hypothetical protein
VRKVQKLVPEPTPLLLEYAKSFDWIDCWATSVDADDSSEPLAWARAFFGLGSGPRLVRALLNVRDVVMRRFGLKTQDELAPEALQSGLMFPVLAQDPCEVILGMDDSHLDLRISVQVTHGVVRETTTVHYNRLLGRVYFFFVRIGHPFLVRLTLARAPRVH